MEDAKVSAGVLEFANSSSPALSASLPIPESSHPEQPQPQPAPVVAAAAVPKDDSAPKWSTR